MARLSGTIARRGRSIARLGSLPPDELIAHPGQWIARLSGTIAHRRPNKGHLGRPSQCNFVPRRTVDWDTS